MVCTNYHIIFFLYLSIVSAQTATYTLFDRSVYETTGLPDPPKPAPDEVAVTVQDGRLYVFAGAQRAADVKRAQDECNGKKDEECFNKVAKVWGYGHDGDEKGLSKRVPPVTPAGALAALYSMFVSFFFSLPDGVGIPVDVPEHPWKPEPSPTVVFKGPDNFEFSVTPTPAPLPPPEDAPSIVNMADGSVEITIPADLIDPTQRAIDRAICKRSFMRLSRRQDLGETWKECVQMASESIAKESDLGAILQKYRGIRVQNMPNAPNGVPLPAGFDNIPAHLNDLANVFSYFGPEAEDARRTVAGAALLISYARLEAGIEISGKFTIPLEKLNRKKKSDECKTPHPHGSYWCEQECGGQLEGLNPAIVSYTCKGRDDNDERKGCVCRITAGSDPYWYPEMTTEGMEKLMTIPKGGKLEGKPSPSTSCYKLDKERMNNMKNWKFIRQQTLDEDIKKFCGADWKDPGNDGIRIEYRKPGKQPFHPEYDRTYDEWNHVALHVGQGGKQGDCERALMEISAGCDHDPNPDINQNINQFNWKWGGERIDESGVRWAVEPVEERVYTQSDKGGGIRKCYTQPGGRFTEHGNKGNNGKELDDSAKMILIQCIHHMQYTGAEGKDDINCGGLLTTHMKRRSWKSREDCATDTWACLAYGIANNEVREAEHSVGFAICNTNLRWG